MIFSMQNVLLERERKKKNPKEMGGEKKRLQAEHEYLMRASCTHPEERYPSGPAEMKNTSRAASPHMICSTQIRVRV